MIEFRRAVLSDADAMSAMVITAVKQFILDDCTPEGAKSLLGSLTPEQFETRIAGDCRYHLALSGHTLAGVVGLKGHSHLYHLFVDQAYSGRGLGRQLLELCLDDARAMFNPGSVTVNSSMNATEFYLHLGFTQVGPGEIRSGIASVPMRLELAGETIHSEE